MRVASGLVETCPANRQASTVSRNGVNTHAHAHTYNAYTHVARVDVLCCTRRLYTVVRVRVFVFACARPCECVSDASLTGDAAGARGGTRPSPVNACSGGSGGGYDDDDDDAGVKIRRPPPPPRPRPPTPPPPPYAYVCVRRNDRRTFGAPSSPPPRPYTTKRRRRRRRPLSSSTRTHPLRSVGVCIYAICAADRNVCNAHRNNIVLHYITCALCFNTMHMYIITRERIL